MAEPPEWRAPWNEARPGKHNAMNASEREALERLPSEIMIFANATINPQRHVMDARPRQGDLVRKALQPSRLASLAHCRREKSGRGDERLAKTAPSPESLYGSPG